MKKLFVSLLMTVCIQGAEFSTKLPIEVKQFTDSIGCFDRRDKMALKAYALALRYRLEHMEDKEALQKSSLDYWRLYSIVHDIEYRCKLANVDDVIEEILAPTAALKKRLKRLRWVESAIPSPDGWAESSERMRRYDKKLLDGIIANPPKWEYEPKNPYLHDYNLSILKKLPPKALPKNLIDKIGNISFKNRHARDALVRYHYLAEEMIRQYDNPKARLALAQERAWLEGCLGLYSVPCRGVYTGNFIRSLASSVVFHQNYSPVREEFLPKEIKHYCEHNVTRMQISPFDVAKDTPLKALPEAPKVQFVQTKKLLALYKKSGMDTKKMERFFQISQQMLSKGNGQNLVQGLQLIRLKKCLDQSDANRTRIFLKTYLEEIKAQDLKEEFTNRVLRPQIWWMTTIGMKIRQEGELPELKHFFDCNATSMQIKQSASQTKKPLPKPSPRKYYDPIVSQKDSILKYYAGTFANKPTPHINNAKAISSGIIPPRWLENNGTRIKPIEDVRVEITGMPKGGIKLTYRGIPKGRACERLTMLNMRNVIYFNHETYDGIDYVLIDGEKVKTGRHFNRNHAMRLCNARQTHTISYVREKTVIKHRYRGEPVDATCDRYHKTDTIDTLDYAPDGFARSGNGKTFIISGNKSYRYDAAIPARIGRLPKVVDNAFFSGISLDRLGEQLAVSQGFGFTWYDLVNEKILSHVSDDNPRTPTYGLRKALFLSEKGLLAGVDKSRQKISVVDLKNGQKILTIAPKCFAGEKKSKYRGPKITATAISNDGQQLYIGTNRKKVEVWRLERSLFGFGKLKATWLKTLTLPHEFKVGAILPDPHDPHHLYVAMENNHLNVVNIKSGNTEMTYIADTRRMEPLMLQLSDDGRYIMVGAKGGIYIWKTGNKVQWDMFKGDGIKGGIFVPGTTDIITISKKIERWSLKK
ncbi:hypothetical protein [Hydrogenimonas sp.]